MDQSRVMCRRTFSIRALIVGVAASAVMVFLTLQALIVRDYHRRGPASEKLLAPIIEYHEIESARYQRYVQNDRSMASESARGTLQGCKAIEWSSWLVLMELEKPSPLLVTGWRRLRNHVVECSRSLKVMRDELREAALDEQWSNYHRHMKEHYVRLLEAHAVELPPPTAVEIAELEAIQAEILRTKGFKVTLKAGLPPHLLPRASRPKPGPPRTEAATAKESTW